jgi:hypothetical protein
MQTITIILCIALILGLFFLFLAPGHWWPRHPPADDPRTHPPHPSGDEDNPPHCPRSLN